MAAVAGAAAAGAAKGMTDSLAQNGVLRVEDSSGCFTCYCCSSGNETNNSNTRLIVQGGKLHSAPQPSWLSRLFSCCAPQQPNTAAQNQLVRDHVYQKLSTTYGASAATAALAKYDATATTQGTHPDIHQADLTKMEAKAEKLLRCEGRLQQMVKEIHYYAQSMDAAHPLPDLQSEAPGDLPTHVTKRSGKNEFFDQGKITTGLQTARQRGNLQILSEGSLDRAIEKAIAAIKQRQAETHQTSISTADIKALVRSSIVSEGIAVVKPPYLDDQRDAALLEALKAKSRLQDLTPDEYHQLYELSKEAAKAPGSSQPASPHPPIVLSGSHSSDDD